MNCFDLLRRHRGHAPNRALQTIRFATRLLHVVTLGLASACGLASPCPPELPPLEEPMPGVLVRHGLWPSITPEGQDHHASSVVLWSGNAATVIDPGPTALEGHALKQALACRQIHAVTLVINTHAHAEQALGNIAWQAPVAASASTQAAMRRQCPDCLAALQHDLGAEALKGTEIVLPTRVLREGEVLTIGHRRWQVLEFNNAHTRSDLVLWSALDRILIAGGLVDDHRLVLAQGSVSGWLHALTRLQTLNPRWIIGQHGIHGPAEVHATWQTQREALCHLVRLSWQGLENGWSETEALSRLATQGGLHSQRQQRFNLLRTWREMERLWLTNGTLPSACQPQTSGGN